MVILIFLPWMCRVWLSVQVNLTPDAARLKSKREGERQILLLLLFRSSSWSHSCWLRYLPLPKKFNNFTGTKINLMVKNFSFNLTTIKMSLSLFYVLFPCLSMYIYMYIYIFYVTGITAITDFIFCSLQLIV